MRQGFWAAAILSLTYVATIWQTRPVLEALSQLADGAQVTAMGARRKLKDTQRPMLIALLGYWDLGLPIGAFSGIYLDFGGAAIWSGLAIGLTVVSVCLIYRSRVMSSHRNG